MKRHRISETSERALPAPPFLALAFTVAAQWMRQPQRARVAWRRPNVDPTKVEWRQRNGVR
ncbi:MAG TPA: hypothetical protein VFW03_17430 [Gemmatimonadaceae bacterium]|nr:hypothetical protein [Gemmatimonadaceae bacterium]